MNKTWIALAALATLAGTAAAQSTLTVYGRVDQAYSKKSGNTVKGVNDTQKSRLGFRGVEDLGGGLKAVFTLEHQLAADTGNLGDSSGTFWNRRAVVGLSSAYGTLVLGRDYSPAYTLVEKIADPWGTDTYAAFSGIVTGGKVDHGSDSAYRTSRAADSTDGSAGQRYNNSINYSFSGGGFNFGLQFAPKEDQTGFVKNSYGLAVNYSAGPIFVGLGYQNPGHEGDNWTALAASYDFGMVKLGAFYGTGKNYVSSSVAPQKLRSYMVSATAPLSGGQVRFGYGELKNRTMDDAGLDGTAARQVSIGYHYFLSKRTTLYVDLVNDSKAGKGSSVTNPTNSKTGYDLGIKHDF